MDDVLLRVRTVGAQQAAAEWDRPIQAIDSWSDASARARRAALAQEDALDHLARTVRDYGTESRQAIDAQVRLEQAQDDVAASMGDQSDVGGSVAVQLGEMTKKAGLAAAAFVGLDSAMGIVNERLDRDYQEDLTAGALGLSERVARRAGRAAGDAYVDGYGESVEDVHLAVQSVGMNIAEIDEMKPGALGRLVRRSLNLTSVFDAEVNEVTRVVGNALRTGMVGSSEEGFDLLVRGFQEGANQSGELLDTLREYAEPVRSLGLDMRDFLNIMVAGTDAGVYSVDRLGDALKEFSIRSIDGSDATHEAFRALGLDARDFAARIAEGGPSARAALADVIDALAATGDRVRRERAGVGLFGAIWEDVGWRAIRALDPTARALDRVSGASRRLDRTLGEGNRQNLERFMRGAEQLALDVLGGELVPAFFDTRDAAVDVWEFVESKWELLAIPLGVPINVIGHTIDKFGELKGAAEGAWDGVTDGVEGAMNGAIKIINEAIGIYNALPDRITGGDIDQIPYIGERGEQILRGAEQAMPRATTPREIIDQFNGHRGRGVPDALRPQGVQPGPIAGTSSRRQQHINIGVNVEGREIARANARASEEEDSWR